MSKINDGSIFREQLPEESLHGIYIHPELFSLSKKINNKNFEAIFKIEFEANAMQSETL